MKKLAGFVCLFACLPVCYWIGILCLVQDE